MIHRAFGSGGRDIRLQFGAFELIGGSVSRVATLCSLASLLVVVATLGLCLVARLRSLAETSAAVLVVVLGLMVTSRVLSDQYLIWPLGLAALSVTAGGRHGRVVRHATAVVLFLACLLSQLIYPRVFYPLLAGDRVATGLLVGRNALVLLALVLAGSSVVAAAVGGRRRRPRARVDGRTGVRRDSASGPTATGRVSSAGRS